MTKLIPDQQEQIQGGSCGGGGCPRNNKNLGMYFSDFMRNAQGVASRILKYTFHKGFLRNVEDGYNWKACKYGYQYIPL